MFRNTYYDRVPIKEDIIKNKHGVTINNAINLYLLYSLKRKHSADNSTSFAEDQNINATDELRSVMSEEGIKGREK